MPRRVNASRTLFPSTEAGHAAAVSSTSHATPGTAVAVVIPGVWSDITNAQFLAIARRDFRVVQTSGAAAASFHITAATAATGSVDVISTGSSITFDVTAA